MDGGLEIAGGLTCCMMYNFLYDNRDNGKEREEW